MSRAERGRGPGGRGDRGRGDRATRIVVGLHPVRELLRAGRAVHSVSVADTRGGSEVVTEILDLAADRGVAVHEVERAELDRRAGDLVHQGVVATAPPFPYADLGEVLAGIDAAGEPAFLVALDRVTDPHNLGSIARTAEAVGAHGLIVPGRRAASVTPTVEKAAAGALAHLPLVQVPNLVRTLRDLGQRGVWSVGLEADVPDTIYDLALLTEPVVVVIGSEGEGLAQLSQGTCDVLASLPMRGRIGSLNASVAAAVALYEVRRRRDAAVAGG